MKIGDEISIKAKIVDFDANPHGAAIQVEISGYNSLRFWIHKLDQPDVIIENKTCHFCGGNAVMTPVTKKVYTCTKCGAEGETLMSVKKEAKP